MTVGINIIIFTIGFLSSSDEADVVAICNKMVIFFAVFTLVGLNGIHRKNMGSTSVNIARTGDDHGSI